MIELRSDTFTLPTPAMREAMVRAELGDDGWGEDPTVRQLEEFSAELFGKEAGLFVTSGTQGNLVSILAQARPGHEVVLDSNSHVVTLEAGGAAQFGGLQMRTIPTARGFLAPEQLREAVRSATLSSPATGLVCIENTHNRHGGTCSSPEEIAAVADVAHAAGIPVHLDGARIFNAALALKRHVREFAKPVDSLTFCLSKGLAAPAGSVVCGPRDFVAKARRIRKQLGGGMRQAGVLAAAGLVALHTMVERLAEDHANAQRLAAGLHTLPGIRLDLGTVQTNIVLFSVENAECADKLVAGCAERGIKIHRAGRTAIRCVTHKDVDAHAVNQALQAIKEVHS